MGFTFQEDLRINPDKLDIEWLEQPIIFAKYSSLSADANRSVRKCEELMKTIRSQLILEVSQKGEQVLGQGVKPTAGNVEAYFRSHSDYQEAKENLQEAQYEAEMLSNAVFAFHQRKAALENLTRLQSQNYFAGPVIPRDLSSEYKDNQRDNLHQHKKEKAADVVKRSQKKTRSSRRRLPVDTLHAVTTTEKG